MDSVDRKEIASWFQGLQDRICSRLEELDGKGTFAEDHWERPGGGGGRSRIILGEHIEKGGVNFSAVEGQLPENISKALKLPSTDFFATGVSIVLHPKNPFVPIIHMNVRYFETEQAGKYWFGGGIDATPHYIIDQDAAHFHKKLHDVCESFQEGKYAEYKKWADDYFYIPHRKETRGIGGIFFDRIEETEHYTKEDVWNFVKSVGDTFIPCYEGLFLPNFEKEYTQNNIDWQKLRRSRYVEFNLVWDKGTKFGLQTNGRIESILMSMPPEANWKYNYTPEQGSMEEETQKKLIKNRDWLTIA